MTDTTGAGDATDATPPLPDAPDSIPDIQDHMAAMYDFYYASDAYTQRYPRPNAATMDFLLRNGVAAARQVLDYGCGNGRYALPLLGATGARVTGFDISATAIAQFATLSQGHPRAADLTLLAGDAAALADTGPYDVVLLLFGVLSHMGNRATRVAALRQVRGLMTTEGRLLLSVPNLYRRRPLDLVQALLARASGRAPASRREPGDIHFTRRIANTPLRFFYHLYTIAELRAELSDAGFELLEAAPESILPEWAVTQSAWLGRVDAAIARRLPPAAGYCMRAVAQPRAA